MDRRKERRLAVDVAGYLWRNQATPVAVCVSQISSNGCRITAPKLTLLVGEQFEITICGLGPIAVEVRWSMENMAGVEFVETMHPAIIQYIASFVRMAG